ncbi:helix-turn-helix domain-containing protein, partial [Escherichia coli]
RVKFPALKGENNPISKLSYEQVIEIKKSKGVNQRELAKKYCVSQTVIHNIQSGKSWRHVNG